MADISKCKGTRCLLREKCYRYTAPDSGWQSYFNGEAGLDETKGTCTNFIADNTEPRYRGKMDRECLEVCDAINLVDGLETKESCCGHGNTKFYVFFSFDTANARCAYPVLRANDPRYGGPNWSILASSTDLPESCFELALESHHKGEQAYKQAKIIADNIKDILNDTTVCKMFNIRRKNAQN